MGIAENRIGVPVLPPAEVDWLQRMATRLPRPLRFMGVGGFGLVTDLSIFTILIVEGLDPLLARIVSLPCATLVTWRLNRAFTFDRTGRHQGHEAVRYAAVTATAQGTSYAVFAVLVLTVLGALPQAALLAGAAVGAFVSYNGHRLFAFARMPGARSPDEARPRAINGGGRNPGPHSPMARPFPHCASLHSPSKTGVNALMAGYEAGGMTGDNAS